MVVDPCIIGLDWWLGDLNPCFVLKGHQGETKTYASVMFLVKEHGHIRESHTRSC